MNDSLSIILGLALAGGACLLRWIGHRRYMRNVRRENPWFYGGHTDGES